MLLRREQAQGRSLIRLRVEPHGAAVTARFSTAVG
jgi:hypothetical protein